jgi:hypothetical protein
MTAVVGVGEAGKGEPGQGVLGRGAVQIDVATHGGQRSLDAGTLRRLKSSLPD